MSELIQILRFRTDDPDTVVASSDRYHAAAAGRTTFTTEQLGRDVDTGEYVLIVTFPSRDAADRNNALPETAAASNELAALATEGPAFSTIEAIG